MKQLLHLFTILVVLLTSACKCKESETCKAFSSRSLNAVPTNLGNYQFTNGIDSNIILIAGNLTRTEREVTKPCDQHPFGGCDCAVCPPAQAHMPYTLEKTIFKPDSYFVQLTAGNYYQGNLVQRDTSFYQSNVREFKRYSIKAIEYEFEQEGRIQISFLDFYETISFLHRASLTELKANPEESNQKIIQNFSTPSNVYSQVLEITIDSINHSASDYLRKVYCNAQFGIVAFENTENNFFYLAKK